MGRVTYWSAISAIVVGGLIAAVALGQTESPEPGVANAPQAIAAPEVAAPPVADDDAHPVGLAELYQQRLDKLAANDITGQYNLGMWLVRRYDDHKKNIEALELAKQQFEHVLELSPKHADAKTMLGIVKGQIKDISKKLHPDYFAMAFSVVGGLGIFLLGMKNMSEGMQAVAGSRLRRMIGMATDNRMLGVATGTAVTCLVQSSSITTVLVVGFVNSGLMMLHQAIGVIMGANIGTTITGWILVLDIGKWGLPILGFAVFVFLFTRKERLRYLAIAAMGLGMVFFGLELMKNGFKPMRYVPAFEQAFLWFNAHTYLGVLKCAMVGCILTFIVQSSSATLGVTIGLASTGVIPFETAAALVLGENIGTTITAWLASIGTTTVAKRAAYAHVMFNLLGVAWITAVFPWYIQGVDWFIANVQHQIHPLTARLADFGEDPSDFEQMVTSAIAATHTGFNVVNMLLFLPLVRIYARFLEWLIPGKVVKETPHLTSLDIRMVESPVIGIEQSRGEIMKMCEGLEKMLRWTREVFDQDQPDEVLVQKIFHREQVLDNMQHEVIEFLTDLMTGNVPHSITEEARAQLRIADELESVSDYVATILKAHLRLRQGNLRLTDTERAYRNELHEKFTQYQQMIDEAVRHNQTDVLSKAKSKGDAITHRFKELRDAHLVRLTEEKVDPLESMSYNTMIGSYRKMKDHALNIAEAICGEK